MRHYQYRGFRKGRGPKPVIKSYKKVLFFGPASFAAGFTNQVLCTGKDGQLEQQTTPTDGDVPSGCIIKYFEIQIALANISSTTCFVDCTLQYKLGGQGLIDPRVVGGHNQRNQVVHMDNFSVGIEQNSTHKFKFKVPKQFQRIREGMQWSLTWSTSNSVSNQTQVIYKFYT